MKKLGHALMIVALIATVGGHWALLQTVAWTTMLAENLQTGSFTEAVGRTFDGRHPCCLCKHISDGKQDEKKTEYSASVKKLEFVAGCPVRVYSIAQSFYLQADWHLPVSTVSYPPPFPPPRVAAV